MNWQTMAHGPNPACFCMAYRLSNFTLRFLEGKKNVKIVWTSISVSTINKNSLEHSLSYSFKYCLWLFTTIVDLRSALNVCFPILYKNTVFTSALNDSKKWGSDNVNKSESRYTYLYFPRFSILRIWHM